MSTIRILPMALQLQSTFVPIYDYQYASAVYILVCAIEKIKWTDISNENRAIYIYIILCTAKSSRFGNLQYLVNTKVLP